MRLPKWWKSENVGGWGLSSLGPLTALDQDAVESVLVQIAQAYLRADADLLAGTILADAAVRAERGSGAAQIVDDSWGCFLVEDLVSRTAQGQLFTCYSMPLTEILSQSETEWVVRSLAEYSLVVPGKRVVEVRNDEELTIRLVNGRAMVCRAIIRSA